MSIFYRGGYKYQLVKNYSIKTSICPRNEAMLSLADLLPSGELWIYAGYAWDGPSGPVPDVPSAMRGSLVHDALYELMRIGGLDRGFRDQADKLLHDLCIEDGMPGFCADLIMEGVHIFGERFTKEDGEHTMLRAGVA